MAFRPLEQRRGGLSTHWIACHSQGSGQHPRGKTEAEARIDLPDKGRRRGSDRDMGALRRRLNGGL